MKYFLLSIALLLITSAEAAEPTITNYQSPGNLQAANPIHCSSLNELSNKLTPADIFPGMKECIEAHDYTRAVMLDALANLYGRVDQLRVEDETAHQAIRVLQINYLGSLPKEEATATMQALKSVADDPKKLGAMCSDIKKIGPPDYYPAYMIQHGMNAVLGAKSGEGVRPNFDMNAAWGKVLDSFLHCPAA